MRKYWLPCICFMALAIALPASAQGRGRQSNFVMTPNGPVPKSLMYPNNMTPQQFQQQRQKEIAEYEQMLRRGNPETYKRYLEWKKTQTAGNNKNATGKK
ncbi:MAG: hypothetical protein JSS27_13935 [Planctomycetes bacterium]|nr:hypothetical protein [Planctomycetota bacterium]